ncbi:hypothetical protein CRP01_41740 [Flavilitoribacter nigricans DSM 23189 = NBRC 102662]|uniref:Phosphoadenosine phosphosulphate reductase domain-containing protein n=2 Tax=Flavilitoribacter TaxID=2762562 RepID=A0A2D0MXA6_FLAN2|nr:hypothetical protein CRP01_41740 [Flavilitoribacter nigricans DSM 23189 = NBRC 102662]
MRLAWFSAGITSTVACKLALEQFDDVQIYYIETGAHHPDNLRYIADCENWFGQKINIVQNSKGYRDHLDVIEKTGYVNGPTGARCTLELKKEVRRETEKVLQPDNQIFGFEYSKAEINRAIRFKEQNPHTNPIYPLIEKRLTKDECAGLVRMAGIELPEMYKLGYSNNNCIGCVKGKKGYWNKIRQDFPEVFSDMAKAERNAGHACIKEDLPEGGSKPVFLDELEPEQGRIPTAVIPSCGIFCQVDFANLIDPKTEKVMSGEMEICEV